MPSLIFWWLIFEDGNRGAKAKRHFSIACHFVRHVLDEVCCKAKSAANPRKLIDEAPQLCLSLAQAAGVGALRALHEPLMGLHPGAAHDRCAFSWRSVTTGRASAC